MHLACRLADVLGYDITRPLVPGKIGDILAELPDFVRKRLHGDPNQLRARIEQRIRVYEKLDGGTQVNLLHPMRRERLVIKWLGNPHRCWKPAPPWWNRDRSSAESEHP